MRPNSFFWLDTPIGACCCTTAAIVFSLIVARDPNRALLPLVFIAVLVLVALRFGALSAVSGGLCAALVFAYFLFTPWEACG